MRQTGRVRGWVLVSTCLAPTALIGGWSLAAARQPSGYDAARDTISALAAHGAADRWIMTTALAVLGICHLATATGLTEAARAGRALLGVGGVATIAVAALPQPAAGHVPAAATGFVALALWPAASGVPGRRSARAATLGLLILLGWLFVELRYGQLVGASERVLAGAQACWPLAVASALVVRRRRERGGGTGTFAAYPGRMAVDVVTSIEIARPRTDVAAYASDPDHATEWYSNINSVEWQSPKPAVEGSRLAFVARFLGRRLAYTYAIREMVPGEKFVMSTEQGPFPMQTIYTWADTPSGGTLMTLRNVGEPSGFGNLSAPVVAAAMRRANRKDLAKLKEVLEHGR